MSLRTLTPWLLGAFLATGAARGDHVLEYQSRSERTSLITHESIVRHDHQVLSLGSGRGRLDAGSTSYVLRSDARKLWVLFHDTKTYWELDTPVRFEDRVSGASRALLEEGSRRSVAVVDLVSTSETRTIGSQPARLWRAKVDQPLMGTVRNLEIWLATDVELDLSVYRELRASLAAFDVASRSWLAEVGALEGLLVELTERSRAKSMDEVVTRSLVSLREEVVPDAIYRVPPGFQRVDFDIGAVFAISGPRE